MYTYKETSSNVPEAIFLNAAIHTVYIRQIKGLSNNGAQIKNSNKKC